MCPTLVAPVALQILGQVTNRSAALGPQQLHTCRTFKTLMSNLRPAYVQPRCSTTMATDTAAALDPRANAILECWLGAGYKEHAPNHLDPIQQKKWFAGGEAVDKEVRERFGKDIEVAASGYYPAWSHGYEGLAGIILMDQLTRNMYRGSAKAFSLDFEALRRAKSLVSSGEALQILPPHRVWAFMPFMHSESLEDQQAGVRHFKELQGECEALPGGGEPLTSALADNVKYAQAHEAVIRQWGRFPHRNALLGRESTPEEIAGLTDGTIPKF